MYVNVSERITDVPGGLNAPAQVCRTTYPKDMHSRYSLEPRLLLSFLNILLVAIRFSQLNSNPYSIP
jgi:hypothetical protein